MKVLKDRELRSKITVLEEIKRQKKPKKQEEKLNFLSEQQKQFIATLF